jgi:hypothetical protein
VKSVAADASGPLSFMDVWDAMCRTIMSAGSRRGAMMATMRCDHPDIEEFVAAKRDPARLRMFNCRCWLPTPSWRRCDRRAMGSAIRRKGLPHGRGAGSVEPDHARHL